MEMNDHEHWLAAIALRHSAEVWQEWSTTIACLEVAERFAEQAKEALALAQRLEDY